MKNGKVGMKQEEWDCDWKVGYDHSTDSGNKFQCLGAEWTQNNGENAKNAQQKERKKETFALATLTNIYC